MGRFVFRGEEPLAWYQPPVSRVWIAVAVAVAIGLGGWFVLRATDSTGDQVPLAAERDPGGRERPALPSTGVTRRPYWEKGSAKATGGAEVTPELGEAAPAEDGVPRAEQAFRRPTTPGSDPSVVTQAEVDRAIARAEALEGKPLTKEKRLELEKRLASRKPKQVERVPGQRKLQDTMSCTGPDAQERYKALNAADQQKMRERCQAHGFVPPQ